MQFKIPQAIDEIFIFNDYIFSTTIFMIAGWFMVLLFDIH